jgi:choline-sulfatase
VSEEGRLLLAMSGMRCYILDSGCEAEYKDIIDRCKESKPAEMSFRKKSPSKDKRPNILFITTDQQAWDTISALGCKYVNTPHLDSLVKSGVSFSKSYTANPICSPARACWLTGITSAENGVIKNGMSIKDGLKTVGHKLVDAGYDTVFAGKLHVGIPKSYNQQIPGYNRVLPEGLGGRGTVGDQVVAHAAADYIRNRDRSKPFYMAVNFLQPHDICNWLHRDGGKTTSSSPFINSIKDLPDLPENADCVLEEEEPRRMRVARCREWDDLNWKYYLWSYYRMVEEVDAEIGRVLNALRETGDMENTVIMFNADHGEGTAHHRAVIKNTPYDEASRVPFIISYPKELKSDVLDDDSLISGMDAVATACDFAGAELPKNARGLSLRHLAAGKKVGWRKFVVTEVRVDHGRLLRSSDYKLIAFRDDPKLLLFDMKNDPGETKNLANDPAYREILDQHIEMLEKWEADLDRAPAALEQFKVTRS